MLKFNRVEEYKYTFERIELIQARNAAGLSQEKLAAKCGWTREWQCELENNPHEIREEAKVALEKALGI